MFPDEIIFLGTKKSGLKKSLLSHE